MSLLLTIPGFTIWRVYFDYMHTHDLGVTQLWVPSVMKEMTERRSNVFVGNNRQEKLASAYRLYRRWCKERRVKSVIGNKFTNSVWCAGKYPRITQNAAKAARNADTAACSKRSCA